MKAFFFILKELLGQLRVKKAAFSSLALLAAFVFLISFYLLFLARSQPANLATKESFQKDVDIALQINPTFSDEEINQVYLEYRRWEEVENINLILAEEIEKRNLRLPGELNAQSDIFLVKAKGSAQDLMKRFQAEGAVTKVASLDKVIQESGVFRLPGWIKSISLISAALFALATVYLIQITVKNIAENWQGELQVLRFSGVNGVLVKVALVTYSGVPTTIGAALAALVLFLVSGWATGLEEISTSMPALINRSFLLMLTVWSLVLGPLLGLLGGILGMDRIDEIWETPSYKDLIE